MLIPIVMESPSYKNLNFIVYLFWMSTKLAIRTTLLLEGCDVSILLDSMDGFSPEKEAFPNANSLRGYEFIDVIKATLEKECPLTIS
jgi:hypothetical protein